ncbi:RNA-splicing factor [Geranomyces variabilis]|nr:RNA-splicing factor [Geranomyces variabilis]
MSYNGIGLSTARGSGTNGYVQRNLSTLRPRERTRDQPIDDRPPPMRKANKEILDHAKKRQIELQCAVLQDELETRGDLSEDEIDTQVDKLRKELLGNLERMTQDVKKLQEHQVHELAEAKEKADARAREAFGIGKDFVAGAAFDRDLQAQIKKDKMLERQRREEEREQRAVERAAELEKRKKDMAKKAEQDAKRIKVERKELGTVRVDRRQEADRYRGGRDAVDSRRRPASRSPVGKGPRETVKMVRFAVAAEDHRARFRARQTPADAETCPDHPLGVVKVANSAAAVARRHGLPSVVVTRRLLALARVHQSGKVVVPQRAPARPHRHPLAPAHAQCPAHLCVVAAERHRHGLPRHHGRALALHHHLVRLFLGAGGGPRPEARCLGLGLELHPTVACRAALAGQSPPRSPARTRDERRPSIVDLKKEAVTPKKPVDAAKDTTSVVVPPPVVAPEPFIHPDRLQNRGDGGAASIATLATVASATTTTITNKTLTTATIAKTTMTSASATVEVEICVINVAVVSE